MLEIIKNNLLIKFAIISSLNPQLLNKSCVLFFVHMSLKIAKSFVRTKYLVHGTLSIIYIFTTHKISPCLTMLYRVRHKNPDKF